MRKQLGDGVRISSVVKANAYGHGITDFVPMAEKCGIDHFAVASSFEAEEVLEVCSEDTRIMIMGIIYDEDVEWAIEHGIECYVFYYERLPMLIEAAKKLNKKARVHLEVETVANRTGMDKREFSKCLTLIKKHAQHVEYEGLCTHFGGAETFANRFKIDRQFDRFQEYWQVCKRRKIACQSIVTWVLQRLHCHFRDRDMKW